jgi:hypothetical protein
MEGDISNKTIVILVVLTVIISVLSTLVVLNEVSGIGAQPASQFQGSIGNSGVSTGKVNLEIKPGPTSTSGQVVLEIIPLKN